MYYRMRTYQAVQENLARFNAFFEDYLLPIQLRHGSRLVGRWTTDDGRVIAIWEYDSEAEQARIQRAVDADPDSARALEHRATLPELFTSKSDCFMRSTLRKR
jgi:hypothetical protein